jgi:methionyl-tRNA synthetase
MPDTFYITTAIDYTNSAPHIGHAYEKVLADVIARYHRLRGETVFFLTGVDQHGQKVQQSAAKAGVPPSEFVKETTQKFVNLWKKLDVKYDEWAATTDDLHKKNVRANLQNLWDDKDPATGESRWLYKKTERGWYSVRQEQFLTDKERGADGEFGVEWQPVEEREEENFYFRLKDHKQWLRDFILKRSEQDNPFVLPDFRVAELLNGVDKIENDLCISRPASRLKWGIPFPENFGAGFVTYVWFDALLNYLSFAPGHDPFFGERTENVGEKKKASNAASFQRFWRSALQIIGKDILIPAHGIYWPIMLKAFGYSDDEMPTLLVHGWWNLGGAKMSKSTGNIVDPFVLIEKYGADAVRLYLTGAIATGWDADFSEERLLTHYNSALANGLGNFVSRTLNMIHRYLGGRLRKTHNQEKTKPAAEWLGYVEQWGLTGETLSYSEDFEGGRHETPDGKVFLLPKFEVHNAIGLIMETLAKCDRAVEESAPWKLAKNPSDAQELARVLYILTEVLRIVAIWLAPIMPKAAHGIFDQLNWKMELSGKEERFSLADAEWGKLPDGHVVGKPVPLFPRIEKASSG